MLEKSQLADFEYTHFPSIKKAKHALSDCDPCLIMMHIKKKDDVFDFSIFMQENHPYIPLILIMAADWQTSRKLMEKGVYHVIHPSSVDAKLLTHAIPAAIEQKSVENKLRSRDKILQTVNYAVEVFLSQLDWESRIHEVLARLGSVTRSDRVYIYKNELQQDAGIVSVLQEEWKAEGFQSAEDLPETINNEYQISGFSNWLEQLKKGEIVWGNVLKQQSEQKGLFLSRDIQSLAVTPIFTDQLWWGFIGYNQCRFEKQWTSVEVDALRAAAKILGAAVGRKDAETRLTHLATHDYLTNLPNRLLLEDRFELAVARAERSNKKFGIVAIDLDKFKRVNDVHGHPFGDKVLIEIAWRLSEAVRSSDTCARMGGDEFTVVAEEIDDSKDLLRVMEKLMNSLKPEILIDGKQVFVSASMGASIYPDHGTQMEQLMKAADIALYQVKNVQSGAKIYIDQQYSLLQE